MSFSESDWRYVSARLVQIANRLNADGTEVDPPEFLAPIEPSQVDEFTRETGLQLPQDLVGLVTRFSAGWRFSYAIDTGSGIHFGGNSESPFIGASSEETLLELFRRFQEEIHGTWMVDKGEAETLTAVKSAFPLHTYEGGGADYTVIRLDTSPCEIVFLDHERAYRIDKEHVIGHGLRDFLRRWASVGFPSCDRLRHDRFLDAASHDIDVDSLAARELSRWVGSPAGE